MCCQLAEWSPMPSPSRGLPREPSGEKRAMSARSGSGPKGGWPKAGEVQRIQKALILSILEDEG